MMLHNILIQTWLSRRSAFPETAKFSIKVAFWKITSYSLVKQSVHYFVAEVR